jgi:hypothetical protein
VWTTAAAIGALLVVVHLAGMYLAAMLVLRVLRGWTDAAGVGMGAVGERLLGGLQMRVGGGVVVEGW